MRTATLITALTLFASGAIASSHYPPDPVEVPHRVALVGTPIKFDDASSSTSGQLSCTTPDPWPFKCAVSGNLTTPEATIAYTTTDTLDDCRDLCINNATCSAFGYEDDYGNCTTMLRSLRWNGLVEEPVGNDTAVFWNRKCFACATVTSKLPSCHRLPRHCTIIPG